MPTFRIPARIEYPGEGSPGYNVWHARTLNGTANLADILDALELFYTSCSPAFPTTQTITIGEGMIQDPYGAPTYVEDDSRTVVGLDGSGQLSPLLCINLAWRTTAATRSGHGRTFLGPWAFGVTQTNGTPVDAVLEVIRSASTTLLNASLAGAGQGWSLGVYSVKDGVLRDFTGVTVRDRFTYLSSRRD